MAKAKRTKKASSPTVETNAVKEAVNIEEANLRTVGPVTRLRGVMAVVTEKVATVEAKLTKWGEENETAAEIAEAVTAVVAEVHGISERLKQLELSGFSPPRKSFTAQTKEGDHVSLLEKYREHYDDLIDRSLMNDLVVIRKNENRGGLVLETETGTRVKAAAAHVVRLSQPQAA
jgi:hypothetical protein